MKRVVLTGSESTGKTSLAALLAAHYDAELVPEFVRDYAARKNNVIDFSDHGPIARGQIALEEEHRAHALSRGARLLVQDTDLLSTMVYCEHYFGQCPDWIVKEARDRRPDLYLLLDIDLPWVADPVRDRGDRREEMQSLFTAAVLASGSPHVLIRGSPDERRAAAIEAIDRILRHET